MLYWKRYAKYLLCKYNCGNFCQCTLIHIHKYEQHMKYLERWAFNYSDLYSEGSVCSMEPVSLGFCAQCRPEEFIGSLVSLGMAGHSEVSKQWWITEQDSDRATGTTCMLCVIMAPNWLFSEGICLIHLINAIVCNVSKYLDFSLQP